MSTFRRSTLATAIAMVSAGFTVPALAQQSGADRLIDEVVVTAQRIEESLQDVPVSVAAIGGEALDARQIDAFDQLQYVVPGMTFSSGVNSRQSASTIRGIGTSLFNIGIESSVAIAVDGVIMGREGAGLFDLSDVERVEVLRGPQGTLFGKNASAGVISITTRAPTDTPSASVSVSYGSKNEMNFSGAVSGPQTEAAGIRPGPGNREMAAQGPFDLDMKRYGGLVEALVDLGEFHLVSLSSYRRWQMEDNNDAALIPLPFLAVNSGDLDQEQFSQELRLVSPRDRRLTYTLGAYYFTQAMDQFNTQSGTAGLDLLGVLPPGVLLGTDLRSTYDETNYACSGKASTALPSSCNWSPACGYCALSWMRPCSARSRRAASGPMPARA